MYAVRTDSDGRFLLKDVPAGRYKFFALHAGFVKQNYRSRGGAEDGAVLSLHVGQKVDDVLFRLTRAAVITGILTNENGELLTGALVAALRKFTEDALIQSELVLQVRVRSLDANPGQLQAAFRNRRSVTITPVRVPMRPGTP